MHLRLKELWRQSPCFMRFSFSLCFFPFSLFFLFLNYFLQGHVHLGEFKKKKSLLVMRGGCLEWNRPSLLEQRSKV